MKVIFCHLSFSEVTFSSFIFQSCLYRIKIFLGTFLFTKTIL